MKDEKTKEKEKQLMKGFQVFIRKTQ